MRRVLFAFALVCLSTLAAATVSVSGNLQDPSGTAVSSRAFVRFNIRGCNGNQPRVTGTANIIPPYQDFQSTAGAFSGTLYDSLTEISCGGSVGATWYGVVIYRDGKPGPEVPYNVTGASFNLNSASPNTTNPVVASPTGDSTYLRLDGGNQFQGAFVGSSANLALGSAGSPWKPFFGISEWEPKVAPTFSLSKGFIWYDSSANGFRVSENNGAARAIGTLTSVATTSPITGGTITGAGTIACASCVTASSPGVGIAHFAGSTQAVTSGAVNLANSDVTGNLPVTNLGSGTSASSSTFWRGDGTWATPTSGGITELNAWCSGTVGTANATAYTLTPALNSNSTTCGVTASTGVPMTRSVTASNMYVTASAAGSAAGSGIIKLLKNGSATTITCTLALTTTCNDTTHTASFAAGDTWSVTVTTGQATDSTANPKVQFQIQ